MCVRASSLYLECTIIYEKEITEKEIVLVSRKIIKPSINLAKGHCLEFAMIHMNYGKSVALFIFFQKFAKIIHTLHCNITSLPDLGPQKS